MTDYEFSTGFLRSRVMPYNWSVVVIWLEMRSTKCLLRPSRKCEQLRKGMGGMLFRNIQPNVKGLQ